ncbi:LIM and sh3 domain protein 1 [Plakobranchus ocellatus]|uniref:LIM and sh3 domain protein 1 n=1 Tax=Plakobranchus ocellatus TaxID=259542 RepID=A0AAV4D5Y0_9GAST|nr:LIM and sh3 domain protein 1 [Plakobranchus ocellatus]
MQPGSIADYDPHDPHRLSGGYGPPQPQPVPMQAYQPPPRVLIFERFSFFSPPPHNPQASRFAIIYQAMYDYTAADDDEVSFMEGDHITNVEEIDAGWMTGRVQRTGQHGMLPSNYVQRIN